MGEEPIATHFPGEAEGKGDNVMLCLHEADSWTEGTKSFSNHQNLSKSFISEQRVLYVWVVEAPRWKSKDSLNILKSPSLETIKDKLQETNAIRNITDMSRYNEKEPNAFLV